MSRVLKFRAWYKPQEKMIHPERLESINFETKVIGTYIQVEQKGYNKLRMSDFVLMQYTGLNDQTGKEIYEGDIAVGKHATYSIRWDERMAQFKAKIEITKSVLIKDASFPLWQYVEDDDMCRLEVIGNIYENPDLLVRQSS